jgi:predicted nucleic acid-binding protein
MKYVLDANVAIKWVLTESDSPKALAVRAGYQAQLHELLAPDVFPVEVAHALTRAERRTIIKQGQAAALLAVVMMNCPQQYPYQPLLQRATAISSQARIGVYDCLYVALAERENCELVTADSKLISKLQGQFPFIVALTSLP